MRNLLIIIFICFANSLYSQGYGAKLEPARLEFYNPDIQALSENIQRREMQNEKNRQYVYNLKNTIIEVESGSIDDELRQQLNSLYKYLESLEGADYSMLDNEIESSYSYYQKCVRAYNNRIRTQNYETPSSTSYNSNTRSNSTASYTSTTNSNSNNTTTKKSKYDGEYLYKTTFDNPAFNVPVRSQPNVESYKIYECPKNSTVFVIDNTGDFFYKVSVDGNTGYVSKSTLKRK